MDRTDRNPPTVYAPREAPARAEAVAWALAFLLAAVAGLLAGLPRPHQTAAGAEEEAEEPPGRLEVKVSSEPPGAGVYLDGELKGRTPLTIAGLRPGRAVVRLEKSGYVPAARACAIPPPGPLSFELIPISRGAIRIETKTPSVEVLLDGEPRGLSPLTIKDVEVGAHELTLRKTNFDAVTVPVNVRAGETVEIAGIEMRDRILAMLEGLVRAEPWRIGHLLDMGHYHFLCGRIDESVACYARANALAARPIEFPAGVEMSEDDRAAEAKLRAADVRKLRSEIIKHTNSSQWGQNAALFREKIASVMPLPGPR